MRYLQQLRFIDTVARVGSIRRAADRLAITSTALNRRILAIEEDLGTPVFERLSNGVQLNAAGELFILHVRQQLSDIERVKSQIADLSGVRRGHVTVVCSQALMVDFLPHMVSKYRALHPGVSFSSFVSGRREAVERLVDLSADLALVFAPETSSGVKVLLEVPQQLYALMSVEHPLAKQEELRFSQCVQYPMALPSQRAGIRYKLDQLAARRDIELSVMVESDNAEFLVKCLHHDNMIAFQIPMAFAVNEPGEGIIAIPINTEDIAPGVLQLAQQRGRNLSVAAARFAEFIHDDLTSVTDG